MKNRTRHTGTLQIAERLPSSYNGNPRYLCIVDGYTCRTAVDSSLGYSITNYEGKQCRVVLGTHYGKTTIDSIEEVRT